MHPLYVTTSSHCLCFSMQHNLRLTEIEIRNKSNGQPEVVLHGKAQAMAASRSIQRVHVSLSHSETYAMATAVLEGEI